VQWSREDELGWDPKGPPQLIDIAGTVGPTAASSIGKRKCGFRNRQRGYPIFRWPEAAGLDDVVVNQRRSDFTER
jgi:hypothetical protein